MNLIGRLYVWTQRDFGHRYTDLHLEDLFLIKGPFKGKSRFQHPSLGSYLKARDLRAEHD
ncbi:hypothetical protein ED733_001249 [Metarhizium rileyi]|uniref:Uncharacterized protein n=1 Tax=Metarhizium rileyi (strain RCEF 4871) TaxID=1649241 RepID=A0A5C6G2L2_METRR|nr:hypothetical protein ED733_001249 [Metarhizium rileyi]